MTLLSHHKSSQISILHNTFATIIMVFEGKKSTWRNHPKLSLAGNVRTALPGFGIASVIFGTYCIGEWYFKSLKADK